MKKKIMALAVIMLFQFTGLATADTLTVGSTFTYPIYSIVDGAAIAEGGGSIYPAALNGVQLDYMYCVDLFKVIYVPGTYTNTTVNNNGIIYGNLLNNAGQVAWLLSQYGTAGQGEKAYALQAAIWHVVLQGTGHTYTLDTAKSTANEIALYSSYLAALGDNTGDVSQFLWITPANGSTTYQGQVAHVPEPFSILLLGLGLAGVVGVRRKIQK